MHEDLIQTAEARVSAIVLQSREQAAWHHHTESVEHLFCLMGAVEVQLQSPAHCVRLQPGQRYTVPAQRIHRLINPSDNPAQYLLVQGGRHDMVENLDLLSLKAC